MKKSSLRSSIVFAALLVLGGTSSATVMKFMSIADLARNSDTVVRGTVKLKESHWTANKTAIYTLYDVQVTEGLKGSAKSGSVIAVTQLGGSAEGMTMSYIGMPEMTVGDDVVLFLEQRSVDTAKTRGNYIIVGLQQGKLGVAKDQQSGKLVALRDLRGVIVDEVDRGISAKENQAADLSRVSLDSLRNIVKDAK